jgi:hypothetical protein
VRGTHDEPLPFQKAWPQSDEGEQRWALRWRWSRSSRDCSSRPSHAVYKTFTIDLAARRSINLDTPSAIRDRGASGDSWL